MSWPLEVKAVRDTVVMRIDLGARGLDLVDAARAAANALTADRELVEAVLDEIFGLGALEAVLRDPAVRAFRYHPGSGLNAMRDGAEQAVERGFRDDAHARRMIERILGALDLRVPGAHGETTGTLGDGSTVRAWWVGDRVAFEVVRPARA